MNFYYITYSKRVGYIIKIDMDKLIFFTKNINFPDEDLLGYLKIT